MLKLIRKCFKRKSHIEFLRTMSGYRMVFVDGSYKGCIAVRKNENGVPIFYAINARNWQLSGSFHWCLRYMGALP